MVFENKYFTALLTALLLFLSFEFPGLSFLVWFSLVPYLFVITPQKVFYSVLLSAYTGIIASILLFHWISVSMIGMAWWGVLIATPGLSLYTWIYITGLWTFLLCTAGSVYKGTVFALFGACVWVAIEILKGQLFSSFPWATLGYSQYKVLHLIQIAEFTGASGISFLIVFFNISLFIFLKEKNWRPLAISAGLIVLVYFSGFALINGAYEGYDQTKAVKTVSLQTNIPQNWKWKKKYVVPIKTEIEKLIREAVKETPDLIIWPEAAVPGGYSENSELAVWVSSTIIGTSVYHIIGVPYQSYNGAFNSAILFDPQARPLLRHDKTQIVAFGEFVPLRKYFPCLSFLTAFGDISVGHVPVIFPFKTVNIGSMICSEDFYGNHVRKFVQRGADVLVNNSNDAWLKKTSGLEQHFAMNVFRAVENRRMLLESANTGVTGLIAPTGEVLQRIEKHKRMYMVANLVPNYKKTFYTWHGDFFAYLCILLSIIFTIVSAFKGGFKVLISEVLSVNFLHLYKSPVPMIKKIFAFVKNNL